MAQTSVRLTTPAGGAGGRRDTAEPCGVGRDVGRVYMVEDHVVESALATPRPGSATDGFDLQAGPVGSDADVQVILEAKPGRASTVSCRMIL